MPGRYYLLYSATSTCHLLIECISTCLTLCAVDGIVLIQEYRFLSGLGYFEMWRKSCGYSAFTLARFLRGPAIAMELCWNGV